MNNDFIEIKMRCVELAAKLYKPEQVIEKSEQLYEHVLKAGSPLSKRASEPFEVVDTSTPIRRP